MVRVPSVFRNTMARKIEVTDSAANPRLRAGARPRLNPRKRSHGSERLTDRGHDDENDPNPLIQLALEPTALGLAPPFLRHCPFTYAHRGQ